MHAALSTLIARLSRPSLSEMEVIPWSCPVPSFGDLSCSTVSTLGLNPSNREFLDPAGNELDGPCRRLHTLRSLGLSRWSDAGVQHLEMILTSCREYFDKNPYDGWFKRLDYIVSGTEASYYGSSRKACHLDLIPYATARKWTELTQRQRSLLLAMAGDVLGLLLRDSAVRLLILNGNSVVLKFQDATGVKLDKRVMPDWCLPRRSLRGGVRGFAYRGVVRNVSGVNLKHEILVLGFNHNIQSSFGVTTGVVAAIRKWIRETASEVLP